MDPGGTTIPRPKEGRPQRAQAAEVDSGGCRGRSGSGWGNSEQSAASVDIGGGGGIACTISCPSNEAMYKVTVKYGGVIDSIRSECRK